jgi:hypothetical protein
VPRGPLDDWQGRREPGVLEVCGRPRTQPVCPCGSHETRSTAERFRGVRQRDQANARGVRTRDTSDRCRLTAIAGGRPTEDPYPAAAVEALEGRSLHRGLAGSQEGGHRPAGSAERSGGPPNPAEAAIRRSPKRRLRTSDPPVARRREWQPPADRGERFHRRNRPRRPDRRRRTRHRGVTEMAWRAQLRAVGRWPRPG